MQIARSPITWFAAVLLLMGSSAAAVTFLKLDYNQFVITKPIPGSETPVSVPPVGDGPPSVFVIANGESARLQEFTTYRACYEAKVAVDIGTSRRILAQCIVK